MTAGDDIPGADEYIVCERAGFPANSTIRRDRVERYGVIVQETESYGNLLVELCYSQLAS